MIQLRNISKTFKVIKKQPGLLGALKSLFFPKKELKTAVDGIDLDIARGEMVGYIGANGAGKSTTIKMMTGILVPSGGEIRVGGLIPHKERQKHARQIGVVFGQRSQLWWDLPVQESFRILREIYEVSKADFEERFAYLDNILELNEFITQPVRTLSLGQRMRADLAASLLHNPQLLFLDEPTIGLDIVVKEKVLAAIKDINKKYGTTVILTTHDMADIEELCQRIVIIDKGKKVYDGSLKQIKEQYGYMTTLVLEIRDPGVFSEINWIDLLQTEEAPILEDNDVKALVENNTLTLSFNKNKILASQVIALVMGRSHVQDIKIQETPIETIVKEIYAGKVR